MSYTSGTTRGAGGDRLSTVFESSKVIQPELAREQVGVPTEDRVHADEFEQTYAEKIQQVTHAVVKQFLSFPSGDIGIVDLPRKFRTLSCSVPVCHSSITNYIFQQFFKHKFKIKRKRKPKKSKHYTYRIAY